MHPSPTQEACLYFLVEMKLVSVMCDALAQRCRLAEETSERLQLEATRALEEQSEKHKKKGGRAVPCGARPG
jgi:hypothetical protein